jgi:hypothetical protein
VTNPPYHPKGPWPPNIISLRARFGWRCACVSLLERSLAVSEVARRGREHKLLRRMPEVPGRSLDKSPRARGQRCEIGRPRLPLAATLADAQL